MWRLALFLPRCVVLVAAVALVLLASAVEAADGAPANLFPDPGFDRFTGDVPEGWTLDSWNQPMMKVRLAPLQPGRDGIGQCLEIQPGNPMSVASLTSPVISVSPGQNYLFKGYYASTCELVTADKRWMDAEGVSLTGKWLDAKKKPLGSFTIPLPDTQDRWVEAYSEVRSPEQAQQLQIVITRRWVGGRLRFDDFSLRQGRIRDFVEEFSLRSVPDEDFFPIFAWLAPSSRYEEPGTNMDSDLQHSQYAVDRLERTSMMNSICLLGPDGEATAFGVDEQRVWLERLCGIPCARPAPDTAPLLAGLAGLSTNIGRFEGDDWKATVAASDSNHARIVWPTGGGTLVWESRWAVCLNTGVVRRQDVLHNRGETAVTLFRCQARFIFPPAPWEVYAQQSHWCGENQGAWQQLHAGALRFGCVGGRTTQDGTPYVALREVNAETGLTFHLLPRGNWSIDVLTRSVVHSPAFLVVTLGTSEEDLRLELPPRATYRAAAQIAADGPPQEYSGATLMDEGLPIRLPQRSAW